jgi:exopolysaccharide biosynthesis operon protein EpsL
MQALAKGGDTFRPFVSYGSFYDDNLFRLAENESPGFRRDDRYSILNAGLNVDWRPGRQEIVASVAETQVRYNRNMSLDYDGHDYQATWNWRLGNHLSGNLGASESLTQSGFSSVGQVNNQVASQRGFGHVDWEFHPRWRVGAGSAQVDNTNGATSLNSQNFQQQSYDVGLTYLTPKGSNLGFQTRLIESKFPNPQVIGGSIFKLFVQDNSYRQTEYNLRGDWQFSGKLSLHGQLGWVDRSYDNSQQGNFNAFTVEVLKRPDFSGLSGRLSGDWSVTGKTLLSVSVYQEPSDAGDINAITVLNRGASVNGVWLMREKLRLNAGATFVQRSFQGDPAASQSKDDTVGASLSLSFTPIQSVSLNVGLSTGSRDSDNTVENYKFHSFFANARADF